MINDSRYTYPNPKFFVERAGDETPLVQDKGAFQGAVLFLPLEVRLPVLQLTPL